MPDGLSQAIGQLAEDAGYLSDLRRRVAAILESQQDVDDVIQDTWLAALEAQPETRQLRAWCRARAIDLSSQALDREKHASEAAGAFLQAQPDDDDGRVPDDIRNEALRRAYSRLAPGDRILLRRRYWLEHSWRKLARDLGVDVASAHRRHRRILRDLRQAMTQPEARDQAESAG